MVGFGHSHLSAYLRAWQARKAQGREGADHAFFARLIHKSFQPNFVTEKGVRHVAPDLKRRMRHILRREDPDLVICALMGNEYNSITMIRHPQPFDVADPESDTAPPEGTVMVPRAMMLAQMRELAAQNALLLWKTIQDVAEGRAIYLVAPPPPIPSEEHIAAHPGGFGELVKLHGLNPAPMRRRMWRLYCAALEAGVAGTTTRFVPPPEEIFEDGFLAERFWQGDPTHANGDYGEIMLTRIRALHMARGAGEDRGS